MLIKLTESREKWWEDSSQRGPADRFLPGPATKRIIPGANQLTPPDLSLPFRKTSQSNSPGSARYIRCACPQCLHTHQAS